MLDTASEKAVEARVRTMLLVYESVLEDASAVYCSTPITSGKRYLDWLARIGERFPDIDAAQETYHASHVREVIEPNSVHAEQVVERLREELTDIVINPSVLPHVQGLKQHHWRSFWQEVIERFAKAVYFVDDWQFSNGAVYEFWVAHRNGFPTFDEHRQPISRAEGIALIADAIAHMQNQHADTTFLEEIRDELTRLMTP